MLTHLLDTSIYCQPIKLAPLAKVCQKWQQLGDARLAISVICEAELLYGLQLKGSTKLQDLYNKLLYKRLHTIAVDQAVVEAFAIIKANARKMGVTCSDFDFLIAATAKTYGLILVTLNAKHFERISGLVVENWGL